MTFITLALIHFLAYITPCIALMYALDVFAKTNLKSATRVVFGITIGKKYPTVLYSICATVLFYLGAKNLIGFCKKSESMQKISNANKYILNGFIITMLNPKALLFWPLVLYPVVVNYSLTYQILTALYFVVATFIFVFIDVYLVSIFKQKMIKGLKYMQAFFCIVMIGFGVLIIFKVLV